MSDYTDFPRYLASKKTIDDRALYQGAWNEVVDRLDSFRDINILEVGGGIGTMIERLLEQDTLFHVNYTLIDEQPENIAAAGERLAKWGEDHGFEVGWLGDRLALTSGHVTLHIDFLAEDLFDFLARRPTDQRYDLLIAHAFLDLVDIPVTLPRLFETIKSGGHFYFTINFDGETIFEPAVPNDAEIMAAYHRTMDERITNDVLSGDSRAGRHLFGHLCDAGGEILKAGSSDWVVFGDESGYPADEAYFLHFIVDTVRGAVEGKITPRQIESWASARHAQIESGALVYIAHQLDFFGRVP